MFVDTVLLIPRVLFYRENSLYFVDAWDKKLKFININRNLTMFPTGPVEQANLEQYVGENPIFGLSIVDDYALISSWGSCSVLKVSLDSNNSVEELYSGLGGEVLFSIATTPTPQSMLAILKSGFFAIVATYKCSINLFIGIQ